jgi:hypothetical protein
MLAAAAAGAAGGPTAANLVAAMEQQATAVSYWGALGCNFSSVGSCLGSLCLLLEDACMLGMLLCCAST